MANAKVSNSPEQSEVNKTKPTVIKRESQVPDSKGKIQTVKMEVKTN